MLKYYDLIGGWGICENTFILWDFSLWHVFWCYCRVRQFRWFIKGEHPELHSLKRAPLMTRYWKKPMSRLYSKSSDISQYHIIMNSILLWPVLQFNNFYYNSVLPPSGITDWIIVCCRLTLTNRQNPFTTLSGAVIKCQGHGLRLMER